MAALTNRITLLNKDQTEDGPEDFLSTSLGVIFPDDVTNQHGDAEHAVVYTSPHLPRPLTFELAEPEGEEDRRLFSHYMWNASLLLAEMVESHSLAHVTPIHQDHQVGFDVRNLSVLELGAGTGLPSIMASMLGSSRVVATDHHAPTVMTALRGNVERNSAGVSVEAHTWGEFGGEFATKNARGFDRVLVADCLWMPWQHGNLRRSIGHFLKSSSPSGEAASRGGRAWVVAGFHTGRENVAKFFNPKHLLDDAGLAVESIYEVDCDGVQRAWQPDRIEDITVRKRWLVVAVLKHAHS